MVEPYRFAAVMFDALGIGGCGRYNLARSGRIVVISRPGTTYNPTFRAAHVLL